MPFLFGFFQWENHNPPAGKRVALVKLERKDITPGVYQLHKLGVIPVTQDCLIWFSHNSWETNLEVGARLV